MEPGFILFGYTHNKLQSFQTASSIARINNAMAVEIEFLWDQLEQIFFLV
jgi:hypothetical protein